MHVTLCFACTGGLTLAIEGPSKVEITCDDNKNGLCRVTYVTTVEGDYDVIIKFDGQHIVGSPFKANMSGKYIKNLTPFQWLLIHR